MNLRVIFKYRVVFVKLFILTILGSCSKEFDLTIPGAEPRLIVEGIITDEEGPYFIRLTKSSNEFGKKIQVIQPLAQYNYEKKEMEIVNDTIERSYNYESVKDALVIISDSEGIIDTLKQISFKKKTKFTDYYEGIYLGSYVDYKGEKVSFEVYNPDDYTCFYYTNKIVGKIGNSYTLDIIYNNKKYSATETMRNVPEIDSVTFGKRITKEGYLVYDKPTLHFKNPPGDDYFLFKIGKSLGINLKDTVSQLRKFSRNSSDVWNLSIKSDKLLPEYVNGLRLPAGISDEDIYQNGAYNMSPGSKYVITLESISLQSYNYLNSLAKQFHSLGGVFHSTPSDPPGNISNGALGFFRVSAVSKYKGIMPRSAWN